MNRRRSEPRVQPGAGFSAFPSSHEELKEAENPSRTCTDPPLAASSAARTAAVQARIEARRAARDAFRARRDAGLRARHQTKLNRSEGNPS